MKDIDNTPPPETLSPCKTCGHPAQFGTDSDTGKTGEWVECTNCISGASNADTWNNGLKPAPQTHIADLEAQLDAVWNAAVEKAAVIANDCIHLTPDPGAAIRVMLNGRAKLHQPTTAAPETNVLPTDKMLNEACRAFSEARAVYPDGEAETQITDWFDLDPQDAVDFGVLKEPTWDGFSDIRGMQHEWYVAAVIKEPMRAALKAVLSSPPSQTREMGS